MESLAELRRKRDNLSVKISEWRKKGKDTTELVQEQAKLRDMIARWDELVRKEQEDFEAKKAAAEKAKIARKIKAKQEASKPAEKFPIKDLRTCKAKADEILDAGDWAPGYQFRSSDWCTIPDIRTEIAKDKTGVDLIYTIQYKTKNHRVAKEFNVRILPKNVAKLADYMEKIELWMMKNSGDLDNNDIVFGDRFNKVQFDKQGFAKAGWKIFK